MGIEFLYLLFIFFVPNRAFRPDQLLKSYTVNSYDSSFSLDFNEEMVPMFEDGSTATLRLVGQLKEVTKVAMTASPSDCRDLQESTVSNMNRISDEEASVKLLMPSVTGRKSLYFCLNNNEWVHQGSENWARVVVYRRILSLPLTVFLIIQCLILSGTLSGLILGLMSWDMADLRVVANARGRKEGKYGRLILSTRKQGNFLLISLAVGATSLNSVFTVLTNMLVSEWLTVICVTLAVVSCCEIIPDLIISRNALIVGAVTICFTWSAMIMTSPISYPLGKLLDKLVGGEIWGVTRDRLRDVAKGLTDEVDNRDFPDSMRLQRRNIPDMPEGIISEMSTGGDEGPTRKSYYRGIRRTEERSTLRDPPSTTRTLFRAQTDGDQGPHIDVSLRRIQLPQVHPITVRKTVPPHRESCESQEFHPTIQ